MSTSDKMYLTPSGVEKLSTELEKLTGVERLALAGRLRDAIKMGDLSENADYTAAKEDQAFLEGRILEIEEILRQAVIIEDRAPTDQVSVGNKVTIVEENGEPETYTLVGAQEADPRNGKISNESPIGDALLGKKIGDEVRVETPGGEIVFSVLKIE